MGLCGRKWSAAVFLAAWVGSTGCGAKAPIAPAPSNPAAAHNAAIAALIARGCYTCLEEAYRKATESSVDPANPSRPSAQAFEAALLLAARSKELGLPHDPWLERARAVMPLGPDWADYLA